MNATFLPRTVRVSPVLPPAYISRPYDHPLGHLLRPLQANLGYYEGSVAIPVDSAHCLTGLGDPAFMMEQRFGVLGASFVPWSSYGRYVGAAGL